jgi:hypothetical protein
MRRSWVRTAVLLVAGLGLASAAHAQVTASDSISVRADNRGIFEFTIAEASFDFGDVDASGAVLPGTGAGVTGNGRNGGDTGGSYTATAAANWTCRSAPSRTVKIYNDSTTAVGSLAGDRLEMQIPAAGGGASQGFKQFSTDSGTPAGDLVTGMTVGNGANGVSGTVDFQLTVLDSDPTGVTTWTVVLTASGT